MEERERLVQQIRELLEGGQDKRLADLIEDVYPADLASAMTIPPTSTGTESAAPTLVGATAYRMLFGWPPHNVREGDVVLVWGGAGGLGSIMSFIGLLLQIGLIFSGALIMEVVFGYPGMGWLTFQAVMANDYSLIMGITLLSIVGVATMVLILDFIYPLFDPRVRHQ